MTTLDKIRVFLAKLFLLAVAIRLRSRWYEEFQDFQWDFIQFSSIIPGNILGSSLEVRPSYLKAPWYYLTKEPELWSDWLKEQDDSFLSDPDVREFLQEQKKFRER